MITRFKIKRTSGNDIDSNIGMMYGCPDGSFAVDLELQKDLSDFIKEQGSPIVFEIKDDGLIHLEILDCYFERW